MGPLAPDSLPDNLNLPGDLFVRKFTYLPATEYPVGNRDICGFYVYPSRKDLDVVSLCAIFEQSLKGRHIRWRVRGADTMDISRRKTGGVITRLKANRDTRFSRSIALLV